MEKLDRMKKLYNDWASAQDSEKLDTVKHILESSKKESSKFVQLFNEMGSDGEKMKALFEDSWDNIDDNKMVAKKIVADYLLEDEKVPSVDKAGNFYGEFGQAYIPIADQKGDTYSSNQMQSTITDGDRDILIQIRYAITSGNYEIAGALILNFWGRLSIKERVDLMSWAYNIGKYNSLVDVPQSKGVGFKNIQDKIEKKEITKEEYKDKFLRTAKEKMKVE